jgi:hypothetical protein
VVCVCVRAHVCVCVREREHACERGKKMGQREERYSLTRITRQIKRDGRTSKMSSL